MYTQETFLTILLRNQPLLNLVTDSDYMVPDDECASTLKDVFCDVFTCPVLLVA